MRNTVESAKRLKFFSSLGKRSDMQQTVRASMKSDKAYYRNLSIPTYSIGVSTANFFFSLRESNCARVQRARIYGFGILYERERLKMQCSMNIHKAT